MADSLKVYFKCREDLSTKPQADTVVVERYREHMLANGITVVGSEPDSDFIQFFGVEAYKPTTPLKPYTITPLLDIDQNTLGYAEKVGESLAQYVGEGQIDISWAAPIRTSAVDYSGVFAEGSRDFFLKAAVVFVQSRSEQVILEKLFGPMANIALAPIGLPEAITTSTDEFTTKYGVKDFILSVARIEPRKNQLMLLKAFEHSPLPIVLVDGGLNVNPAYEAAVKNFRRKGQTIISGKISQSMITSAIRAARVHVLPSFFEIPGVVSLEAIRQGCPVVATRSGTTADYLRDGAVYCNPADTDSIYNATLAAYYGPRPQVETSAMTWKEVVAAVAKVYHAIATGDAPETVVDAIDAEIEKAEGFALNGDLATAIATIRAAEETDSADARIQRAFAALLLTQGKVREAKSRFTLANKLDPSDSKTLRGLAMCAQAENNIPEAHGWLVQAVTQNPDDANALLQLLKVSYSLKKFDAVEKALAQYCGNSDCSEDIHFSYAGVLFEQKKNEEAFKVCQTILSVNPGNRDAQQLIQRMNGTESAAPVKSPATASPIVKATVPMDSSTADKDIAKSSLASAVTKARFDATPTVEALLAQLEEFRRNMKLEDLRNGLIEAQKTESTFTTTQRQRLLLLTADYHVMSGQLDQAKSIFTDVSKEDPYSTRALCGLGALTANGGSWSEAQRYFTQAISIDPRQDIAYAGLGLCAKQDNQLERAWGFYRTALSINPENMRALLGLMEIGYPMKRYADIEQALRGYLELHPADTEFSYSLAGCLFAQNRMDDAAQTVNTILTFKPDDSRAQELSQAIHSKRSNPMTGNAQR